MRNLRFLILIGQLGRIWSKNRLEIKIFQSMTAAAFFMLFIGKSNTNEDNENFREENNQL